MRWNKIDLNPDSEGVVDWRDKKVIASWSRSSDLTYEELIALYCTSKKVLDFGAANHHSETAELGDTESTHRKLSRCASAVTAVDIVPIVDNCDFESHRHILVDLSKCVLKDDSNFEVFFAGHVIEHLEEPGLVFRLAKNLLTPGGILIIATPSPLWIPNIWDRATGSSRSINVDHVAVFGVSELVELSERHGVNLVSWFYAGRRDMPERYRPRAGLLGLFVAVIYRICRFLKAPFSHNQIIGVFQTTSEVTSNGVNQ